MLEHVLKISSYPLGTTEGRHDNNTVDEDKNVDFSTVEEIRLKVNQYFKKLKGIGGPRVMELFKKLNATLENPDSETKQTVCSSSSQYFTRSDFLNLFNFFYSFVLHFESGI